MEREMLITVKPEPQASGTFPEDREILERLLSLSNLYSYQ